MSAPPGPPDGFGVVADQLRTLAGSLADVDDSAAGIAGRLRQITASGAQTGRCCPAAGQALSAGLRTLAASVDELGNRAVDGHTALRCAARTYDEADISTTETLTGAGAEP